MAASSRLPLTGVLSHPMLRSSAVSGTGTCSRMHRGGGSCCSATGFRCLRRVCYFSKVTPSPISVEGKSFSRILGVYDTVRPYA